MTGRILRTAVAALLGALVGVFLTVLMGGDWIHNTVIGFFIGLVSAIVPQLVSAYLPRIQRPLTYAIGVPVGMLAGIVVHLLWPVPVPGGDQRTLITILATSIAFGGTFAALFFLHARKTQLEDALRVADLRKLEAERRGVEAQLKMLQAQIEPHFLFNTLANVSALIATDAPLARRLLDRLIVYLRAALARTRSGNISLGDEIELLRAYLDICRIRMGERLSYVFEVPETLASRPFPPMLLQPLVENAVKHGLEPKLTSGSVRVHVANSDARLRIVVVDDGVGFGAASAGTGTGIANVSARLAALYGENASLSLEANREGGVTATLELPI
jgi:sensor histidine kinase YesM